MKETTIPERDGRSSETGWQIRTGPHFHFLISNKNVHSYPNSFVFLCTCYAGLLPLFIKHFINTHDVYCV